ncbi:Wzz/FepE/Etk N-terminal domain-containing protein [Devosia sp. 2618]|uniref:GumC family protein n=1 Tax=Devosia sp. 2618 TaxID=3156454 RepID=UPI00339AB5A3
MDVDALSNIDFRFYLSLFRRRLPLLLSVAALVAIIGVAVTFLRPAVYEATAKILVESAQIPTELAKSTVPTGAAEQFQIIQEDVLSRESLLALADHYGIYASQPNLSQSDKFDDMERRVSIAPISVDSAGGTAATVIQIAFKADDPNTAANLVNDLVTMILNKDVQLRTARATETVTFFDGETKRLDDEMSALDAKILAFKNDHINAMPDSMDFRRNQQTASQQRLLVLSQEEATLRKQQTDLQTRPFEGTAAPVTPEEQNLAALRQSLVQQQDLFSDTSPTIMTLRARIAAQEAAMAGTGADDASGKPITSRDFQIDDIKDRLAEIASERASIVQTVADLDTSIAATPANETVLNALQRDHQNVQAQYDSAVARLAEASTGQQIELLLKGERLSLIERAVPPQTAQGPSKKVLLAGSAIAALLLGLLAVIAPEFLNRRIRRPAELTSRLQIVPFITVPYIEAKGRNWAGPALGLGVVAALTLLMATQNNAVPLSELNSMSMASFASAVPRIQP